MSKEIWVFTFGSNHTDIHGRSLQNNYVVIEGNFGQAREQVMALRGPKWAFQYSEKEFEGQAERFGLTQLSLNDIALN